MSAAVVFQADFDDPAEWIDLAFACSWPELEVRAVVAPGTVIKALRAFAGFKNGAIRWCDASDPGEALAVLDRTASWIVAGSHSTWCGLIAGKRDEYRRRIARTFVVGGHANSADGEAIPVDPRLREAHPERFGSAGDPRVPDANALASCLVSGEGVVWLPRDTCLWRFDAAGMLSEIGGVGPAVLDLLSERFPGFDRVLMSSIPAWLLAALPEPMAWLRWFRIETARFDRETGLVFGVSNPNLHVVAGVDGHLLNRRIVGVLSGTSVTAITGYTDPTRVGDVV